MALTIENPKVERLAIEVAEMTNESATEAIRVALQERADRLKLHGKESRGDRVEEIVARFQRKVPPGELGRRLTKAQWEEMLGYGPGGV